MNTASRMLGRCAQLGLLWLAMAPAPGQAAAQVVEAWLDNGLQILVKPDHRAPVVTSMVYYKVGSSYEHDGITGVSHLLEHMMFKGTAAYPAGEFSRIIAANGGSQNAFTSRDYTGYYQTLESSRLAVSFELEADRMRNLVLPDAEYVKENKVVQEERRMRTDDNPQAMTNERFMAAAFLSSGYHWPIIGWMNDIEQTTAQDLRDWYRRWYAPNNAVLVVVGDVDPQQVIALAKTHFGPLEPTRPGPVGPRRGEAEQLGEKRVIVKAPARLGYVQVGYLVPVLRTAAHDWEPYALEVLAWILDGDDSSRLSREMIRGTEVAVGASASYSLYARSDTLLTLAAIPAPGHDGKALEDALDDQVSRLRDELVSADELERVRTGVIAHQVYGRDSLMYQASQLGGLAAVGLDWGLAEQYPQRVAAVTAEQVRAVARKYLTADRRTVATLVPQSIEQAAAAGAESEAGDES